MRLFSKPLLFTVTLLLSISSHASVPHEEESKMSPFATFNQKYYQNDQFVTEYWSDVGAISGEIIKREPGPSGRSILHIKLKGVDKHVWVGTINKIIENQLKVGDNIDVLGFFDETAKETQFMAKMTDDKEYLIGFCFNVHETGLPIYNTKLLHHCIDWESGALDVASLKESINR